MNKAKDYTITFLRKVDNKISLVFMLKKDYQEDQKSWLNLTH